ncbi:hypothetical protein L0222_24815 [bacterium]|nr:hypothetical protein [bacterium]MCI0604426.1 hypothetical protein [bacterium]
MGKHNLHLEEIREGRGPGNVVMILIESENVTELFSAFGERGVRAETVSQKVVDEAQRYLQTGVPVG